MTQYPRIRRNCAVARLAALLGAVVFLVLLASPQTTSAYGLPADQGAGQACDRLALAMDDAERGAYPGEVTPRGPVFAPAEGQDAAQAELPDLAPDLLTNVDFGNGAAMPPGAGQASARRDWLHLPGARGPPDMTV